MSRAFLVTLGESFGTQLKTQPPEAHHVLRKLPKPRPTALQARFPNVNPDTHSVLLTGTIPGTDAVPAHRWRHGEAAARRTRGWGPRQARNDRASLGKRDLARTGSVPCGRGKRTGEKQAFKTQ